MQARRWKGLMEKKPELRVVEDTKRPRRAISRREMVERLLSGAGAALALPAVAASHPIHKHLANASTFAEAEKRSAAALWRPAFLDPHQNETLIALAESIVPGSTRAQVNRFIDLLLSVDNAENQKRFLNALHAFEAESLNRFAHPFKKLAPAQQDALLTLASAQEPGVTEEPKGWGWFTIPPMPTSDPARINLRDHFENLKGWISGAYYSSEIGMKELGWTGENFFDSFPGCQHPEGHD